MQEISEAGGVQQCDDCASAIVALLQLPDRSAVDIGSLANRIGVEKLTLIQWLRADVRFARLVASKVIPAESSL